MNHVSEEEVSEEEVPLFSQHIQFLIYTIGSGFVRPTAVTAVAAPAGCCCCDVIVVAVEIIRFLPNGFLELASNLRKR